ncbi:MAG: DUF4136 domain-containing protein [Rhodoferax sp.]|nr:DUF4136 domain-containing protein [Rhodoferax sp.]
MYKANIALIFAFFILTACTGVRLVDSQVSSYAPKPVVAGASYQFERLPSQQANADTQGKLELLAVAALNKVGLRHKDGKTDLLVQVHATQRNETTSIDHPSFGWQIGWFGAGKPGHHGVFALGNRSLFPGLDERTNYWREVRLTIRDQATQSVVYETRASHDGPWSDGDVIWPAIFDAALQGFPQPPAGGRRVGIEVPR